MGGSPRQDAYYLRLFARGMEEVGDPDNIAIACATWDEFRQEAVREGWFTANGPEAATLYLHMAGALRKIPHELLAELQMTALRRKGTSFEDIYFLYPERLYERACALDPHFESFAQWMEWAKRDQPGQAERVAEAWHKIRPTDIEPILLLMEEKEKRNAFHTALQYLAKAERIDSVHPSVRRARLRLLGASALRHLQQKKPNLAAEKLAEMETLPQSQQGDRPAFLAALRYMVSAARGANDAAAAHRAEVERALGSKAAALLIFGMARAAKQGAFEQLPALEKLSKAERAELPEAVVRVVELAKDMQMDQGIPGGWLAETSKQFPRSSQSFNVGQLQSLAEAALTAKNLQLAYAVSGAGLEREGPAEASFLLLRALSLPEYLEERRAVCALAAAQLARQQRDMDVVEKAVELIAESPFDDLTLTQEQASAVVRKEKAERAFPTAFRRGPDYRDFLGPSLCDCPKCRRARGESIGPFGDNDDEDDFNGDFDDDSDFDAILDATPLPPDMPPEIAKMLFEETRKAVQRGESLDSMLNRAVRAGNGIRQEKQERQAEIMDPRKCLALGQDAGEEEIRAAYVRKVKEHPPDRSPEEFERIRDAYDSLRDPRRRMRDRLLSADPVCAVCFGCRTEGAPAPVRRTAAVAGGAERKVTAGMSREEILRRFEKWLDSALAAEDPPRGIDAEILAALAAAARARARRQPPLTLCGRP